MPSRDFRDAILDLVGRFIAARQEYEKTYPDRAIIVTCTQRSVKEQAGLYAMGRTQPGQIVTEIDGVTKKSLHNCYPSHAIDFAILLHGKISWAPSEYRVFGQLCEQQGLVWGGNWKTFADYAHVQLPNGIRLET